MNHQILDILYFFRICRLRRKLGELTSRSEIEEPDEPKAPRVEKKLTATDKQALEEIIRKIYYYGKLAEYIDQNMKNERHKTYMKLQDFIAKLKNLKEAIKYGEKETTAEEVRSGFPDEYDIKFLTGTSLQEKKKKIDNAKQIIQKTLNNIKERSLKEAVFNHFKPIIQYLNSIQNKKYELFPFIAGEEKSFPLRVVNRNIKKGDLIFTIKRIKNCPAKRYFFIKAQMTYRGETETYESKINKEGGMMNHSHTFHLEDGRKINHTKMNSAKMRLSIHKQHRLFLFKYRLVSEMDIDLKRLNKETNAVYDVKFEYKNNTTLDAEIALQTHEALHGNTINLKLLTIKKRFPPIKFMKERGQSSVIGK
jgi:prefoldin subunit 5